MPVLVSSGLQILEADSSLTDTLASFQSDFVTNLPQKSVADRGIEDPSALIAAFQAAEASWKDRLANIDRTDAEAVAALIRAEIYGKANMAQLGQ